MIFNEVLFFSLIRDVVLVFPCESRHTICVECFRAYCVTNLDSRRFIETDNSGYTITCPGNSGKKYSMLKYIVFKISSCPEV
jgi:hypothetical protein